MRSHDKRKTTFDLVQQRAPRYKHFLSSYSVTLVWSRQSYVALQTSTTLVTELRSNNRNCTLPRQTKTELLVFRNSGNGRFVGCCKVVFHMLFLAWFFILKIAFNFFHIAIFSLDARTILVTSGNPDSRSLVERSLEFKLAIKLEKYALAK